MDAEKRRDLRVTPFSAANSYLSLLSQGSVGFTIAQMAELCLEMGCINAYNLDGGSSSTVVLNNQKINALSTGKIRPVGDCIYFATLIKH